MKKFAMAVVAAASLGTAFADSCANSFTGFYAGVQAGMNNTTGTYNIDGFLGRNSAAAPGNPGVSSTKATIGKRSFLGGIFAGYGMGVGSCAYVGAELYGNFGNTSQTIYDTSTISNVNDRGLKVSMNRKYNLGAKVRLGYTVSPQAMIFLGLGLEYAKMELKSENIMDQAAAPQTGVERFVKKSKGKISFAPSIGMDMFVNKNVFIRGEYTYVMGLKQTVSPVMANTAGTKFTATVKTNLTQQRFTLGLGYKF